MNMDATGYERGGCVGASEVRCVSVAVSTRVIEAINYVLVVIYIWLKDRVTTQGKPI